MRMPHLAGIAQPEKRLRDSKSQFGIQLTKSDNFQHKSPASPGEKHRKRAL
jgi:hypothetical protein